MSVPDALRGPVVVVSATGAAAVVPDLVSLAVGVEVVAGTPAEALQEVARRVDALLGALDEAAVDAGHRRTTGLHVHPDHDHATGRSSGHRASAQLRLTALDVAGAGRLVQRAADAVGDALRVHDLQLQVSDPEPAQVQARAAAVRAVRRRAQELAEAAGHRLGDLLELVEDGGGGLPEALQQVRKSRGGTADWSGPGVEPGTTVVTVTVSATYRLG